MVLRNSQQEVRSPRSPTSGSQLVIDPESPIPKATTTRISIVQEPELPRQTIPTEIQINCGGCSGNGLALLELADGQIPERFPPIPTEREKEAQEDDKDRILRRMDLPAFNPKDEEEFEDWVEEVAVVMNQRPIALKLLQRKWLTMTTQTDWKQAIMVADTSGGYEKFIDQIARTQYPFCDKITQLEKELINCSPKPTVKDAATFIIQKATRFLRMTMRYGVSEKERYIGRRRMATIFHDALPRSVASRIQHGGWMLFRAETYDAAIARERIVQDIMQYEGFRTVSQNAYMAPAVESQLPQARRPGQCHGCGAEHFRMNCPYKDNVCTNCNKKGHLPQCCRLRTIPDGAGGVKGYITENIKGGARVELPGEGTKNQMMDKIGRLANQYKDHSKRPISKPAAEPENVFEKHTRKMGGAAVEQLESESESDVEEFMGEPTKNEVGLASHQEHASVYIDVKIGDKPIRLLADSGAGRSLCNKEVAKELGLSPDGYESRFDGIQGSARALRQKPVSLSIGNRSIEVRFYVLEHDNQLPPLLGMTDLRRLRAMPCPVRLKLIDVDTNIALDEIERVLVAGENEKKEELNMEETLDEKLQHLSSNRGEEIRRIFENFPECWKEPKIGGIKNFRAHIEVQGRPIKSAIRRLAPELKVELEKELEKLLESQAIRESKSPWGSPPVFVKKKDGTWRLCIDYRAVNKLMKSDAYPLPLIWEQLQLMAGKAHYSCLDCQSGFWQLPLDEASKEITAIVTHKGTYEFNVMPFGIKTSGAEFQRAMDTILGNLAHKGVSCYVDDIVIHAQSAGEHDELLREVLDRLVKNGVCIKMSKAEIDQPEIPVLGHLVGLQGIRASPQKVQGIIEAVAPTDKAILKSFLGTISYLRRFIPNLTTTIEPLTRLMKKGARWEWGEEQMEAFERLKAQLADTIMLRAPKGGGIFRVMTDASNVGIGALLMQEQDNEWVPLEFASRTLTTTERNWDTREREAFAIKWAVEKFRDYIKCSRAIIQTDHESLRWMASAESGKVQRWAIFLQQFDIQIEHIAGVLNPIADWLSRSGEVRNLDEEVEAIAIPAFAAKTRHYAPRIPTLMELHSSYETMTDAERAECYLTPDNYYASKRTHKLFIPKILREGIMYWFHVSRYGGHMGANRTLRRMRQWVYWSGMAQDVRDYVTKCLVCIRKLPLAKNKDWQGTLAKPRPMELVSADFVGPRLWGNARVYYLVILDHYSRFMLTMPLRTPPTARDAQIGLERWVSIFGAPTAVLTDNGSHFQGDFKEYILQTLLAYHALTSPYYPEGNGMNEASHKTIDAYLKTAEPDGYYTFESALQAATLTYNATPSASTLESPFYMLMGFNLVLPGWQQMRMESLEQIQTNKMAAQMEKVMRGQMLDYGLNRLVEPEKYQEGDLVVTMLPEAKRGQGYDGTGLGRAYTASWSLPARVMKVKDGQLQVMYYGKGTMALVPIRQCRRLEGEIPTSLAAENAKVIARTGPQYRHLPAYQLLPLIKWNEILGDSWQENEVQSPSKRSRTSKSARGQ